MDSEVLVIGGDPASNIVAVTPAGPVEIKSTVVNRGALAADALLACQPSARDVAGTSLAEPPFIPFPPKMFEEVPTPDAEGVEYDIIGKGGAVETVKAGQMEGVPNPELLAQRRLAQMQMVTRILRKMKRKGIKQEAQAARVKKNRKKSKLAKASRKKNR